MTLKCHLVSEICSKGPIPVSDYMSICLTDPEFGYYNQPNPIGKSGAFTTAPEISQMFGELIGICLSITWQYQGAPSPFTLVELGPGRGTMMADLLRAASKTPYFVESANLLLLETSSKLRNLQYQLLADYKPNYIESLEQVPNQPLFLVANEFFDALPVQQFRRTKTGWNEIHVGVDAGELVFIEVECEKPTALYHHLHDTKIGHIIELRPDANSIIKIIVAAISAYGGLALIIDYGNAKLVGDTLQAVKDHEFTSILSNPGETDISSHVDFTALRQPTVGVNYTEPVPQGLWLEQMGIRERATVLAKNMDTKTLEQHTAALQRLIHPQAMGNLFKVMGIYQSGTTPPPGFHK